ncbi:MAG TPA: PEGA domain-containing protein [Archangium sp.]|uniref:PEGA domain-containing protein n=1 Tax=Archangium sp. TaxID=1872627 RepID=UPI002E2F5DD4|nr:PEGA domain-containing protein [Archangium sp.]HEX5754480.1 PEGA domain-containing protein [Archangium sp.]
MSGNASQPSPSPSGNRGAGAVPAQPVRPVAPAAPAAPAAGRGARWEGLAAGLKLASALSALVAVGLFVRPLLQGELTTGPRMITLQPTFSSAPVERPAEDATPGIPAPAEPPPETGIREERADFEGAILMVESEPSGATILVDGKDQGETPVSVGLECLPGTPVLVEFSLRGYEKAKHRTVCPHDALVKVTARLRKGPGKGFGKK